MTTLAGVECCAPQYVDEGMRVLAPYRGGSYLWCDVVCAAGAHARVRNEKFDVQRWLPVSALLVPAVPLASPLVGTVYPDAQKFTEAAFRAAAVVEDLASLDPFAFATKRCAAEPARAVIERAARDCLDARALARAVARTCPGRIEVPADRTHVAVFKDGEPIWYSIAYASGPALCDVLREAVSPSQLADAFEGVTVATVPA